MFPIILKIGPFVIRSYGLMMALAFLVGIYFAQNEAKRKGIDQNLIFDYALYALVFGLLGSRLYYALFYEPEILFQNPLRFFALWQGGLAIHGSIIAGILVGIWFCKKRRISFWDFGDTFAPSLFLGEAIGRIGCFCAGCCYGISTDVPWAVTFNHPKSLAPTGETLHPTQIYTLLANLLGFIIVWNLRKRIRRKGAILLLYLIMSSIFRFFIEFYRADRVYFWEGFLSVAQIYSIIAIIASIYLFLVLPNERMA